MAAKAWRRLLSWLRPPERPLSFERELDRAVQTVGGLSLGVDCVERSLGTPERGARSLQD